MSSSFWLQGVSDELEKHEYMTGVERTLERIKATGEIFTPTTLVLEMCDYLGPSVFAPQRTVLDPACGDGQFLVAAKAIKIIVHRMTAMSALAELFGVDIMRDNVDVCRRRLGGGTIIMGNSLAPDEVLEGQTAEERILMIQLFEPRGASSLRRKPRLVRRAPTAGADSKP